MCHTCTYPSSLFLPPFPFLLSPLPRACRSLRAVSGGPPDRGSEAAAALRTDSGHEHEHRQRAASERATARQRATKERRSTTCRTLHTPNAL